MSKHELKRHDDELTEKLRALYKPAIARAGGMAYSVLAGEPIIALNKYGQPAENAEHHRRTTSYMKMKNNLDSMKKSTESMRAKLKKAMRKNESLSRQLKKSNRKNEKLMEELACSKSRVRSLNNAEYDPSCPSMTNFEEHTQQLAKRNMIRPRQPPSIVTSTITSGEWEEGHGQPQVQTNQTSIYQIEESLLTGQSPVFDIGDLEGQQLIDLFVLEENDVNKD